MRYALILVLLHALPAAAQSWRVVPGTKVRIQTVSKGRVTGVLHQIGPDSLVITPARGAPVALGAGDLQRVEISGGRSRLAGAGAGAFWGAGIGGVVGWLGGSVRASACPSPCPRASAEELATLGAISSIWLGALIGAAVGREVWVPLTLQWGPPSGAEARGAARLQWSVRF